MNALQKVNGVLGLHHLTLRASQWCCTCGERYGPSGRRPNARTRDDAHSIHDHHVAQQLLAAGLEMRLADPRADFLQRQQQPRP